MTDRFRGHRAQRLRRTRPAPLPPKPTRRAWDDKDWPQEMEDPERQHLPFLELRVDRELTFVATGYRVGIEVENTGNATAYQAIVELYLELQTGSAPPSRRRFGFKTLGRIDPHTAQTESVLWSSLPDRPPHLTHAPIGADLRRLLQLQPFVVGVAYDPILQPRPDLDEQPRAFPVQVVRHPFSWFTRKGGIEPIIPGGF